MIGVFRFLPIATLQTMQVEWTACLSAIATAHQSYSIAGRSFTRANLKEVQGVLEEILWAIELKSGRIQQVVYSDMSNSS